MKMHSRFVAAAAALLATTTLIAADTPPPPPWQTSLGAGLALTSGNTDTKNINFAFTTKHDPKTKSVFKAEALYLRGEANGVKQVDKATASVRDDYSLSERTFAFGQVAYLRDPFKDITYFIAPIAGAGYRVIKSDVRNLTVDAGAGAQVESGRFAGRRSGGAVKSGEAFDWTLSPSSRITQNLSGIWKANDFGDALYHFDAGLTTTIVTRAELKFAYTYDYKNKPPLASIKKGDSALVATILFKF